MLPHWSQNVRCSLVQVMFSYCFVMKCPYIVSSRTASWMKENSSCLSLVSPRATRRQDCGLEFLSARIYLSLSPLQVQIRPWKLSDSDFIMDHTQPIDPRKTIFIGGVPRTLKACELAMLFFSRYGGVCYAGIDCDPEFKYPKGVLTLFSLTLSLSLSLSLCLCECVLC